MDYKIVIDDKNIRTPIGRHGSQQGDKEPRASVREKQLAKTCVSYEETRSERLRISDSGTLLAHDFWCDNDQLPGEGSATCRESAAK